MSDLIERLRSGRIGLLTFRVAADEIERLNVLVDIQNTATECLAEANERLTADYCEAREEVTAFSQLYNESLERIAKLKAQKKVLIISNEEIQERIAKLEGALLECTLDHDEAHYIAQQALDEAK